MEGPEWYKLSSDSVHLAFAPYLALTMTSSSSIERGLNTRREAVRLAGSELLALSFQTLGLLSTFKVYMNSH